MSGLDQPDDEPDEILSDFLEPEQALGQPTSQVRQQTDQSTLSGTEWNVYLHHPHGTVEHIVGPFPDEEQAKSEMDSQKCFGLFPESKGYCWECREEP
jgi:hypothetical protein